ncbi:MAG: phosphoenolpyruvate carboxykinase (ATP), partial [Flavobacteriales bacterium]
MQEHGRIPTTANLNELGLGNVKSVTWNATPAQLVEETIRKDLGKLTDTGALAVDTGKFTGRSPQDRFIVCDEITEDKVWWGKINKKFDPEKFDALYNRLTAYLGNKEVYARDNYVCADKDYQLNIRTITELPWSNIFADNMFLRPSEEELKDFNPDWHVICAPNFEANPEIDDTRQNNFAIINFTKKMIIIGGTGYTGEIKKGVFSVLNYILPEEKGVLSMHCSANIG